MKTLDVIDEQLIALLCRNARTPVVTLAKSVGLSRSATQERLSGLERSGVIAGYTARINRSSDTVLQAWLTIRLASGHYCGDIAPVLLKRTEVRLVHALAGPIDVLALVQIRSSEALSELRDELAQHKAVAEVDTALVLKAHL
jgi:Lrp/AsnC family transcriptional regulator, leucine-responsive regulatory protein